MRSFFREMLLKIMWGAVARRVRAENPYVIAVVGSVGKTSTKEAVATVLSESDKKVTKTIGNLATDTGIPLSLLGFHEQVTTPLMWLCVIIRALTSVYIKRNERPYWVIECSSDKPGDHAYIGERLPYDVAVFTAGGPVHLAYYKNQEGVTAENADFLRFAKEGARIVVNGDDPFLRDITWPEHTTTYGVDGLTKQQKPVDIRGKVVTLEKEGMKASFAQEKKGKLLAEPLACEVAVVGRQQLAPVVAAVTVGLLEGMAVEQIQKGVHEYQIPAGRGRLIPGIKESTIVDDSANASPEAAVAGLSMLKAWAGKRRTVAILGNMNELGDFAEEAHREVAAAAASTVKFLVTVGLHAEIMREAAIKAGMPSHHILAFATPGQLFSQIGQIIERNDIIYIKASQNGMRLERLVKQIMAHPSLATRLLVRQTKSWKE